jgi:hypothetical protein
MIDRLASKVALVAGVSRRKRAAIQGLLAPEVRRRVHRPRQRPPAGRRELRRPAPVPCPSAEPEFLRQPNRLTVAGPKNPCRRHVSCVLLHMCDDIVSCAQPANASIGLGIDRFPKSSYHAVRPSFGRRFLTSWIRRSQTDRCCGRRAWPEAACQAGRCDQAGTLLTSFTWVVFHFR